MSGKSSNTKTNKVSKTVTVSGSTGKVVNQVINMDNIIETGNTSNITQRKKRIYFTEEQLKDFKLFNVLDEIEDKIESQIDNLRELRNEIKGIRTIYQSDLNRAFKAKRTRGKEGAPQGFNKKSVIPDKMTDLVSITRGTAMSTPEYTSALFKELKKRGLYYEKDRRVLRVDKEVTEVLGVPESVNKSIDSKDENGFNISTIQSYISKALQKWTVSETSNTISAEASNKTGTTSNVTNEVKEVKTKASTSKKANTSK